jgi:hypothetical protein
MCLLLTVIIGPSQAGCVKGTLTQTIRVVIIPLSIFHHGLHRPPRKLCCPLLVFHLAQQRHSLWERLASLPQPLPAHHFDLSSTTPFTHFRAHRSFRTTGLFVAQTPLLASSTPFLVHIECVSTDKAHSSKVSYLSQTAADQPVDRREREKIGVEMIGDPQFVRRHEAPAR